ncbi:hypothetical protein M3C51_007050 [Micrococcus luteus]|nr:hypothetical protein [Micrococcus luteus]
MRVIITQAGGLRPVSDHDLVREADVALLAQVGLQDLGAALRVVQFQKLAAAVVGDPASEDEVLEQQVVVAEVEYGRCG